VAKENGGSAPVMGGVAAIITAIGGLSGLVIALKGTDSTQPDPPNPNPPIQTDTNQSNVDVEWEAYYNACGNGIMSRDEFTSRYRNYFDQVYIETGARPDGCG
jgi:hypothetical protein